MTTEQRHIDPWMPPQAQALWGYVGQTAPGGIPNGSKVKKTNSKPGDKHPDGSIATVEGSVLAPDPANPSGDPVVCYLVIWEDRPGDVFFITEHRIEKVD